MDAKKKKIMLIGVLLLMLVIIIGILVYNKSKMQETKNQQVVLHDYPVQVYKADYQHIDEVLTLSGNAIANAEVNYVSETQGRVTSVNFDIGSRVGTGTLLASVDDEIKKANLMTAEANFEKAKKDYDRYKQLFDQKSINEATLDQYSLILKTSEAQYIIAKRTLKDTKVTSPISGVVTAKSIEKGSFLNIGTPIATILDINTIKIRVQVAEASINKVRIGDDVRLKSDLFLDKTFVGNVKFINPKADESHTYSVDISIQNRNSEIKPGMFFNVFFDNIQETSSLVIPRESLVGSAKEPQVYVVNDNKAMLKNIKINKISGDLIDVASGINEGDIIVTSGQINLINGSKVRIVK